MSDVAAYHIISTYIRALETTHTLIHDMLPHHS